MILDPLVYALCTLTSIACAWLLFRAFARTKTRLLLWSGLCFMGLALNNALVFSDLILLPNLDLSVVRLIPAVIGLALLLYGLIMETE